MRNQQLPEAIDDNLRAAIHRAPRFDGAVIEARARRGESIDARRWNRPAIEAELAPASLCCRPE
jgi:hypothetical protein